MKPFFVPGRPISLNQRLGLGRRVFVTRAASQWMQDVYYAALAAKEWDEIILYPQISYRFQGTKADVDNLLKCVNDGLKRALGRDDRYFSIVSATVLRCGEPGVWITIQEGEQG